jgi:hypothetical protein
MSRNTSSRKKKNPPYTGIKPGYDRCYRCADEEQVVSYIAKSTNPISRHMHDTASRDDSRYVGGDLNPKGKTIKTGLCCISPQSVSSVRNDGMFYKTPFEFFILLSIREHINLKGILQNLKFEYNPSNTDQKMYDLLITDGGTLKKSSRAMVIEVDENGHYNDPGYFQRDRKKENFFLNSFRKGADDGTGTKLNGYNGSATILRIRVAENGETDGETSTSRVEDICITSEIRDGVRCAKVQNKKLFDRNIKRIVKHISRFFSDNGDFNSTGYINMNNDKGIQSFNVDFDTRLTVYSLLDLLSQYDYGEYRKPSPTSSTGSSGKYSTVEETRQKPFVLEFVDEDLPGPSTPLRTRSRSILYNTPPDTEKSTKRIKSITRGVSDISIDVGSDMVATVKSIGEIISKNKYWGYPNIKYNGKDRGCLNYEVSELKQLLVDYGIESSGQIQKEICADIHRAIRQYKNSQSSK